MVLHNFQSTFTSFTSFNSNPMAHGYFGFAIHLPIFFKPQFKSLYFQIITSVKSQSIFPIIIDWV